MSSADRNEDTTLIASSSVVGKDGHLQSGNNKNLGPTTRVGAIKCVPTSDMFNFVVQYYQF